MAPSMRRHRGLAPARRVLRRGGSTSWALVALAIFAAACSTEARAGGGDPLAHVLEVGGARIRVILPARGLEAGDEAVLEWIAAAARAVAEYEGRFPVPGATVRIRSHGGRGVGRGIARLAGSPEILVSIGEETDRQDLRRDWVMTHEMIHLGFPSVGDRCWMEEGLAMYLEPVARARVGALSAEEAWGKLAVFFPKGLPKERDRGLDLTSTWGRTYWGGAMFWFVTDIEIRSRTRGRKGLEDVLRAIVAAGGTIGRRWDVERVIAVGDGVAGAPVLRQLYRRMARSPDRVDLASLWRSLGVRHVNGHVVLDDAAPLAWVRRAITGAEGGSPRAPRGPRSEEVRGRSPGSAASILPRRTTELRARAASR